MPFCLQELEGAGRVGDFVDLGIQGSSRHRELGLYKDVRFQDCSGSFGGVEVSGCQDYAGMLGGNRMSKASTVVA